MSPLRHLPLVAVLLAVLALPAAGQPRSPASLAGTVVDTAWRPLGEVRVQPVEVGRTHLTGADGGYRFTAVAPGTRLLSRAF